MIKRFNALKSNLRAKLNELEEAQAVQDKPAPQQVKSLLIYS